jgi:hypothetical protein
VHWGKEFFFFFFFFEREWAKFESIKVAEINPQRKKKKKRRLKKEGKRVSHVPERKKKKKKKKRLLRDKVLGRGKENWRKRGEA